jgi:precorrin-6B methylase 2
VDESVAILRKRTGSHSQATTRLALQPSTAPKSATQRRAGDPIFVPTPQDVVEKMLELAAVRKDDVVYDLGCGDGRIVVTAARKYGCRAAGYDIDTECVRMSRENVRKHDVEALVDIAQKDVFTLDVSPASVVTLYMGREVNLKLVPQLQKLKPGSRIVSHNFDIEGFEPDKVIEFTSADDDSKHSLYLWTVPLKKKAD